MGTIVSFLWRGSTFAFIICPMTIQHKIRSFVRREGRLTKGQQRAFDELLPIWGIELSEQELSLASLFEREAPVHLEIGFGMGQSLLQMAAQQPQNNFIGIEVHRPGVGALLAGIEQQQLTNIRVCNADAVEVLQQMIPDASLAAVYIFFPDPWHKKRHNKRRLIQPEFVKLLCKKLQSDGVLHAATDWQEYAEQMLQVLQAEPKLINMAAHGYSEKPDYRPLTKFELRGKKLGHGVWDLLFKKISAV